MLSRTAENLYWISRYMERAETTARLIDVGYRMSLFPNPNGHNNEWESVDSLRKLVKLHVDTNFKAE